MPELPEVESIRRTLEKQVTGQVIKEIQVYWPPSVSGWGEQSFLSLVNGQRITGFSRRGKYLLITLDGGYTLLAHMRMTGRLLYAPDGREPEKHTRVVFLLERGELHFWDIRKFGRIQAIPTGLCLSEPVLGKLGPEPLDDGFTPELLQGLLEGKKSSLKAALIDQRVVAGIGNIYADEALYEAGLSPERPAGSLSRPECERLRDAIRKVLDAGIVAGGASIRDYRDGSGNRGRFQETMQVYGRGGKPCYACGRPLTRLRLAGRATVYCANCQS